MYESPTNGLVAEETAKATTPVQTVAKLSNGKCMHLPSRPVYRTIKVRDTLRVMDMCRECYDMMDRAGCIDEVLL